MPVYRSALFWFRRDLRDEDNAGLFQALQLGAARALRLRLRPRDPRRRCRAPTGAWSSSTQRAPSCANRCAARGGELIVLHGRATEARPRPRAAPRGGRRVRQRRLRARRPRARRRRGKSARRRRPAHAPRQGPGDLREGRGAHAGGASLQRLHALSQRVAEDAGALPSRGARGRRPPVVARAGAVRDGVAVARGAGVRAHQPRRSLGVASGMSGARRLLGQFAQRIGAYAAGARLPGARRRVVPGRAQPLRHRLDPRARAHGARARGRRAQPRGSRSWRGATSSSRSSGTTRGSRPPASAPSMRTSSGPEPTPISTPGARAAPAIRSSTRGCASSSRPATCTTGCAW